MESAAKVARTDDAEMEEDAGVLCEELNLLQAEVQAEKNRIDRRILVMAINDVDVSEVFSPPRIAEMATSMGLVGGKSFGVHHQEQAHQRTPDGTSPSENTGSSPRSTSSRTSPV